jgi:shikimate dehydrogenase
VPLTGPRRAAVLGRPIAHSLSPVLHRAAYAALGLTDWSYEAIECDPAGLPLLLDRVRADAGWAGLSLTMPLKETVLGLIGPGDQVDALAARVGSANTVVRRDDGSLLVTSTDVAGVAAAVAETGWDFGGGVAVLGSGGTARAAVAALRDTSQLTVVARSADRAAPVVALHPGAVWTPWADFRAADHALVVATVPAGATDELARRTWPAGAALVEVLYDPWPTALAAAATSAGARVVGGLAVLVAQAVAQVTLMTGRAAPVEIMRAAGEAALAARSPVRAATDSSREGVEGPTRE